MHNSPKCDYSLSQTKQIRINCLIMMTLFIICLPH